MMNVETREPREKVSCFEVSRGFEGVRRGALGGLVLLVRKGVGLGVVLFLALSTFSFLNHGAGFLEASLKSSLSQKEEQKDSRSYTVSRPVSSSVAVNSSRSETPVKQSQDMTRTIRESGYFLNSLDYFTRSLAKMAK